MSIWIIIKVSNIKIESWNMNFSEWLLELEGQPHLQSRKARLKPGNCFAQVI